jgi:hypothetical protein
MFEYMKNLDRRWIFLLMLLSVAVPILVIGVTGETFPEVPTKLAQATFDEVDNLNEGDPVLLSFDFDPGSEGELGPMATAFVRHCCEKKLKLYFMALWPVGPQMIEQTINNVIKADFPHLVYGEDYVNLGFKSGNEGVIKVVVTDLRQLYTTDSAGTSLDNIPMMRGIRNIRQMRLIINVSAGYAGTKEWVQYAATPYANEIRLIAGCTGVQAPLLYPYIPQQLPGLLGAIKGAAEYEALVMEKYGQNVLMTNERGEQVIPGKYLEGQRRMGPQLVAHILMILLILAGNVIFFIERKRGSGGAR